MRIIPAVGLWLATGCVANRVTALDASRLVVPGVLSVTTPASPRLTAPDARGLIVLLQAPVTPPRRQQCFDCVTQVSAPYVMIIDGDALRFPEDSARLRRATKRLRPRDIKSLQILKGVAASERYLTDGRPVILIRTKRAK